MKVPIKRRLNKWQWFLVVLSGTLVVVLILLDSYLPWFQAQMWYLHHLNGVPYMGKVIPVPRGMVQARNPSIAYDSTFFVKSPTATREAERHDDWDMFFTTGRLPNETPAQAITRVGANLRDFAARTGKAIGPAFAVDTQEGNGWCYTTTLIPRKSISMTCLLFNAQWSVSYTGPPNHKEEFFKVIAGIHDLKK